MSQHQGDEQEQHQWHKKSLHTEKCCLLPSHTPFLLPSSSVPENAHFSSELGFECLFLCDVEEPQCWSLCDLRNKRGVGDGEESSSCSPALGQL